VTWWLTHLSPLSTIFELKAQSFPTTSNGDRRILSPLSTILEFGTLSFLVVGNGDQCTFSPLSTISKLRALSFLAIGNGNRHLFFPFNYFKARNSKLSCCWQWQSTPPLSSFRSFKVYNFELSCCFWALILLVMAIHLPFSFHSTLSKLKAKSFLLYFNSKF